MYCFEDFEEYLCVDIKTYLKLKKYLKEIARLPMLPPEEYKKLYYYKNNNSNKYRKLRSEVIEANLRFVWSYLFRFLISKNITTHSLFDLIGECNLSMINSLDNYESGSKNLFDGKTFFRNEVRHCIEQYILQEYTFINIKITRKFIKNRKQIKKYLSKIEQKYSMSLSYEDAARGYFCYNDIENDFSQIDLSEHIGGEIVTFDEDVNINYQEANDYFQFSYKEIDYKELVKILTNQITIYWLKFGVFHYYSMSYENFLNFTSKYNLHLKTHKLTICSKSNEYQRAFWNKVTHGNIIHVLCLTEDEIYISNHIIGINCKKMTIKEIAQRLSKSVRDTQTLYNNLLSKFKNSKLSILLNS